MGIELRDCLRAGELLGLKMVANEFIAYHQLGQMISEGALPYDEWQSQYGGYLTGGTHYGCRHTLQMFVQAVQIDNTKTAREEQGIEI